MRKNINFILKVVGIHIATYMLFGILFQNIFDYTSLFTMGNVEDYMKPAEGITMAIGPLIQIIRGILFGFALLLMKEVFLEKNLGWLKLWLVLLILGIINTPGPAPGSIEGIIYTKLPLEFHLKIVPEIALQTLFFSYLVAKPRKIKKTNNIIEKNREYIIPSVLAGIMFSLSGIVLSIILKIDVMAGTEDLGAFIVMFFAILIVFMANKWLARTRNRYKWVIISLVYYTAMAVLPTSYNYLVDSPFKSPLTLGINILPVIILVGYNIGANSAARRI